MIAKRKNKELAYSLDSDSIVKHKSFLLVREQNSELETNIFYIIQILSFQLISRTLYTERGSMNSKTRAFLEN